MIELNYSQAQQLLAFFGGHDSQVTVEERKDGHSGPGLYAHCTDYPEEGAIFLDPEPSQPAARRIEVQNPDDPDRTHSDLAAEVLEVCKARGWSLHWTCRGAYLHLEASELIEAIRGKRGDPTSEAADVLIVLMSITQNAGIPWAGVLAKANETVESLRTKPRYRGEEYTPPPHTEPATSERGEEA